ncbi:MAG: DNA mismatch repair endonuclease MutL [Syntrophomonas sp.]
MAIKLLDEQLINKIAAGEVIEKPASIVKELVENSIDAGAKLIAVKIARAGMEKIEVEDDGEGISYDELPLAFLRHATSKIAVEADLEKILTMGFRGEALPSIASVSRVDIYSRRENQDPVHALIEGGELLNLENFPAPIGTKIIVRDLFFNTPARKKFLKSSVTEGNHVYEMLCKYALARPDISFSFSNEKKQFFKTPGSGKLRDAVTALFGNDYSRSLIDLDFEGQNSSLSGLISSPGVSRINRKNQFFFVNNRPVRSPMLYKAVDTAYRGLLLSREHPVVLLQLSISPEQIDVNVHPQKTEIRFRDEQAVFKLVHNVLKSALDGLDFPVSTTWSPFEDLYEHSRASKNEPVSIVREQVLPEFNIPRPEPVYHHTEVFSSQKTEPQIIYHTVSYKVIGQVLNSYILLEEEGSLWIIDQHAAHERVFYNRLKKQYASSREVIQILAVPVAVELSGQQSDLIENNMEFFSELGFELEPAGYNSILLRAVPGIAAGQEQEVLFELLDLLQQKQQVNLKEEAIIKMACKKAVKAGNRLNFREMETIIEELLGTEECRTCPHGRPTMIKLSRNDLERMFKR